MVTTASNTASETGVTDPRESGLIQRVQAEFLEMPGLRLTLSQAARLWGLDIRQSAQLLAELISTGFLVRDTTGAYRRHGCPRCA